VAFASIVAGLLVGGPTIFGVLLVRWDSYAVPWGVFAGLAALVSAATLMAGPAIDRERNASRSEGRGSIIAMAAAVGVVGDFNPKNPTHVFTNEALEHLKLSFEWVATDTVAEPVERRLGTYAGVWIAPASPYRSMDGALAAIRYARERGVPLVGT
jgi:CTP synthase (UTP-ammonia lyase)